MRLGAVTSADRLAASQARPPVLLAQLVTADHARPEILRSVNGRIGARSACGARADVGQAECVSRSGMADVANAHDLVTDRALVPVVGAKQVIADGASDQVGAQMAAVRRAGSAQVAAGRTDELTGAADKLGAMVAADG